MSDRNVRVIRKNGKKPIVKSYPKTASTAFDKNSLVEFASGVVNPSDDNDVFVFGVILQEIASTDADYASATSLKQVELILDGDEVEIDTTAVLTVGVAYGISNAYTVDSTDTTNDVFVCTRVLSATRAQGFFKNCGAGVGV